MIFASLALENSNEERCCRVPGAILIVSRLPYWTKIHQRGGPLAHPPNFAYYSSATVYAFL